MNYTRDAGFVPERTTNPSEAFLFWCIDGAAILATGHTDPDALLNGVRSVFGTHLPPEWPPAPPGAVGTNTDPTQLGYDQTTRTILSDAANRLDAHTDGAMGYGDDYPDLLALLLALLCAHPARAGGESFLVDGHSLITNLAKDSERRHLVQFLWSTPIEQCIRIGNTPPNSLGYLRSQRPVVSQTVGGRLTVRYNREHQRLLDDAPVNDHDRDHLASWQRLGQQAAEAAPRFLLQPGELLLIDNYRVLHGREPYQGTKRFFHRIHGFTDMSFRGPNA